jgi:hypothetical protein
MQTNPPDFKQAKRIYYWYWKGFRPEDVALIERVEVKTVNDTLYSLGVEKGYRRPERRRYSTHMKNILEWVISHQPLYKDKINVMIKEIESKIKIKGRIPKGKFPEFLASFIVTNR